MAVSKRLRFEVLRRDNHACRYCGASAPDVKLVIDHVLPEALGGQSVAENLVAACVPCNLGKTSMPPDAAIVADVNDDVIRWTKAMTLARMVRRQHVDERNRYIAEFERIWSGWTVGKFAPKPVPLEDDYEITIAKFFEHEVDLVEIAHAVKVAMHNRSVRPENTFRYFCGVVWNVIREIQDTAQGVAASDHPLTAAPITSPALDDVSWARS